VSLLFIALLKLFRPDVNNISAAVFGASGTIVALALPAAELAGNSISRIGEYWIQRFADSTPGSSERPNKEFALKEIRKIKERALTARRGSAYVLGAFILGAFSLITPQTVVGRWIFRIDYLLVGFSFGLLIVGAALFFPFTWSVYRLNALEDAEAAIANFPDEEETKQEEGATPSVTHSTKPLT
jgi:hypothetical protein